jgi:hypothetical protein
MLAIHDQLTPQVRHRLKITVMGLGLVRLLQDVGRTEEARTTLHALENGFPVVAEKSDKPKRARNNYFGSSLRSYVPAGAFSTTSNASFDVSLSR